MAINPMPAASENLSPVLGILIVVSFQFCAVAGEWLPAADMNETRQYPGLARLPDGKILAVTGHPLDGKSLASAELYDPTKDTWTPTGSMNLARNGVEPDGLFMLPNGRVLITGGGTAARSVREAELYDPEAGTWTETGFMAYSRCVHTSTQLADGRVLVTGGIDWANDEVHATAEIYSYATGAWNSAGTMSTSRWNHRAVRLPDGRVLVIGGVSNATSNEEVLASAEIFDPETGAWSETSPMQRARRALGAALLNDGRVLVVGGKGSMGREHREVNNVEIYDPSTQQWSDAAPLIDGRWGPSVTVLHDGQVLVVGGMYGRVGRRNSTEIFDPVNGTWRDAGSLQQARNGHRAITLDDGRVLIVGGFSGSYYLSSCEIYEP